METELDYRIDEAVQMSEDAIGEVWGKVFPEVTTGDFPPDAHMSLNQALEQAVRVWLEGNSDLLDR